MEIPTEELVKVLEKRNKQPDTVLQIIDEYGRMFIYYQSAIDEIETKLKIIDRELSNPGTIGRKNVIHQIQTRVKSLESIVKKLERKDLQFSREIVEKELSDVAGIRMICSYIDDIYAVLDSLAAQSDVTVLEIKDYIKNPKPSGYRSLHVILEIPVFFFKETKRIKVELQIRTIAMDFWASLEHGLRYKLETDDPDLSRRLEQTATTISNLEDEMLMIRNKIEAQIE